MEIDLTDVKQEKPVKVTAKYNGKCGLCDVPIVKGYDTIALVDNKWCHIECAEENSYPSLGQEW